MRLKVSGPERISVGIALCQNCALDIDETVEPLIEGDHPTVRRLCECGHEGVIPGVGSKHLALRVCAPTRIYSHGLISERYTRIRNESIINVPGGRQRDGVVREHSWVGRQAQEPLLSQPAKETDFRSQTVEPRLRGAMMFVSGERKSQPHTR